jgi:putative ABC transport system permease protein
LPKLKSIYWHNNIVAFAPSLETPIEVVTNPHDSISPIAPAMALRVVLLGTWLNHAVTTPDGGQFVTGIDRTHPWWRVHGRWFEENTSEIVVGAKFAKHAGLQIGDHLNVSPKEKPVELTVTGILSSDGPEDDFIVGPLQLAQQFAGKPEEYRKLYVSALTKPEDAFARRDPKTMDKDEFERWSCSPYVSSIAYSIAQALPGTEVRVIHRVADGEGSILTHVRTLLWLVTFAALLAAGLAVGASSAATVMERRSEIALMKAIGAGGGSVGFLLASEQLLLALAGGGIGYAIGIILARVVGERIFGAAPEPSLLVLLIILGLAACVTMLGSAIPLRRASRFQPAPILRGE